MEDMERTMKARAFLLTLFFLLVFFLQTGAKVYTPQTVPIIHLQNRNCYVNNPDNILSQGAVDKIDALLRVAEDSTGVQVYVAVLDSINSDDCFDFAHQVGEFLGVGQSGKDNGLVVLFCLSQREIRFVTGYGMEGIITDALCKRIQEQYMVPSFRKGNWDEGMTSGMEALQQYLLNPELAAEEEWTSSDTFGLVTALLVFLCPIAAFFVIQWRNKKCPKCGKLKLKTVKTELLYKDARGKKTRTTLRCTACGHEFTRDTYTSFNNDSNGGNISGGFGGGVLGGGGSIGGSYGGGHFGGGGAGSRF